jgi:hypothetical protein
MDRDSHFRSRSYGVRFGFYNIWACFIPINLIERLGHTGIAASGIASEVTGALLLGAND